jgi:hypothetical protein
MPRKRRAKAPASQVSPDAAMPEILFQATLQQYPELSADEITGLTVSEIRQLALKRRFAEAKRGKRRAKSKPKTRPKHPDRAVILANYRQRKARHEPNAAKNTAQWVAEEVKAGRLSRAVHPDTLRAWDREDQKN